MTRANLKRWAESFPDSDARLRRALELLENTEVESTAPPSASTVPGKFQRETISTFGKKTLRLSLVSCTISLSSYLSDRQSPTWAFVADRITLSREAAAFFAADFIDVGNPKDYLDLCKAKIQGMMMFVSHRGDPEIQPASCRSLMSQNRFSRTQALQEPFCCDLCMHLLAVPKHIFGGLFAEEYEFVSSPINLLMTADSIRHFYEVIETCCSESKLLHTKPSSSLDTPGAAAECLVYRFQCPQISVLLRLDKTTTLHLAAEKVAYSLKKSNGAGTALFLAQSAIEVNSCVDCVVFRVQRRQDFICCVTASRVSYDSSADDDTFTVDDIYMQTFQPQERTILSFPRNISQQRTSIFRKTSFADTSPVLKVVHNRDAEGQQVFTVSITDICLLYDADIASPLIDSMSAMLSVMKLHNMSLKAVGASPQKHSPPAPDPMSKFSLDDSIMQLRLDVQKIEIELLGSTSAEIFISVDQLSLNHDGSQNLLSIQKVLATASGSEVVKIDGNS